MRRALLAGAPVVILLGVAVRNVCHIALFGAEVKVRRGAEVLRKVCS